MNTNEYETFVATLVQRKISQAIADWMYAQMTERWKVRPSADQVNTIDPDDWYEFIVEGCIELCNFRPTSQDVEDASRDCEFATYIEFAEVFSKLSKYRPEPGTEISKLTKDNCSPITAEVWQILSQLNRYQYNDQFVIRCFLDRAFRSKVLTQKNLFGKMQHFVGKNFLWLNMTGSEERLKRSGYTFDPVSSLGECKASEGSVLKIEKKANNAGVVDNFQLLALVTKARDGQIFSVEIKPSWNSPFRMNLKGLEFFFFRDLDTRVVGLWNPLARSQP